MSWEMLSHGHKVKVRRLGNDWEPALGWAVNAETGELDATLGLRITGAGDRPTRSQLVRVRPGDWIADDEAIPGLPLQQP